MAPEAAQRSATGFQVNDRDRRAADRASADWRNACGNEALPSLTDLGLTGAAGEWHNRFLIRSDSYKPCAVFIACGNMLRSHWDMEGLGSNLEDTLPGGLRDRFADGCQRSLQKGGPVQIEGSYHNPDLSEILFRGVMLPMQAPISGGNFIYGGYSQKIAP
jgi:hypothetical protein